MKRVLFVLGAAMLLAAGLAVAAVAQTSGDGTTVSTITSTGTIPTVPDVKVFVCKYVGTPGVDETLQTGQNPISVSVNATGGAAVGSFFNDAQGRSYVLAIDSGQPEPGVDQCPPPSGPPPGDIPVTAGVSFTEATCTTPPSFQLTKTIPGLRFYDVEGPALVNGHPVAGGTYTITALPDEGYVVVGQSVFVHTFAPAPTDCGGVTVPNGAANVICLLPAGVYQLSGMVDGQVADSVSPATLPGNTKGVTNVVVTRGDTSVRTTVSTNGDCGTTTTVVTTPPPTVTPPVVTPPAPKPVVKPQAKPTPKPKAKPKPKPVTKKKAEKRPTVHICKPVNGHKRVWVKTGGPNHGCQYVGPAQPSHLTG